MFAAASAVWLQVVLILFGALLTLGIQYLTDRLRQDRQERLERKRRRAIEREAAFREMAERSRSRWMYSTTPPPTTSGTAFLTLRGGARRTPGRLGGRRSSARRRHWP